MSGSEKTSQVDTEKMAENMAKLEALTRRLTAALAQNDSYAPGGGGQELYIKAASAYIADMMTNPARMIEAQVGYWKKALELASGAAKPDTPARPDKRFAAEDWDANPMFAQLRDQYLLASEAITDGAAALSNLPEDEKRRVDFFTRQFVEMMSPSNFMATNPEVLNKAVATQGESLVQGLENLVKDLEFNKGRFAVSLADRDAFEVGENLATTDGEVVFRNRMFELIQYAPLTENQYALPLVIFPPWINKFYILDMQPKNSFIRFALEQGFNVFVVSWVNPDESYAETGLDDYMFEGTLEAFKQIQAITGQDKLNAIGYCIGGTLLTATLAWMAKTGADNPVESATFFTTLTDFRDPGELGVFIEDGLIDHLAKIAQDKGMLEAFYLGQVFSYLRPADLVYGPAVKHYMLGEKPPAFDLLYWNGDSPNLPAKMAVDYLRQLYRDNKLAKGEFVFGGETINMADIEIPIYVLSTVTDHIAPWRASFHGLNRVSSKEAKFVLAGSGHIAGVVNPPSKNKYGHWINQDRPDDLDSWLDGAIPMDGSWWPNWARWLAERSGEQIEARPPGGPDHKPLAPAPGTYVKA